MGWLREFDRRFGGKCQRVDFFGDQERRLAESLDDIVFTIIFFAFLFFSTKIPPIHVQSFEIISADRLTNALKWTVQKTKIIVYLILLYLFIPIFFSYFPGTRYFVLGYLDYFIAPIRAIFRGILDFIPNLIFIAITIYVMRYVLRLLRLIFSEVKTGRVVFTGFHKDWAEPTFKLSRFLLIMFTIVLISPYMPGFGSPAFQGISIFFGILLSLGSTAAIANVVAGAALTYMRPFKVGDRVKIADTVGDVMEKTLLITRIRTIKNVEVTIPNSMVLGSHMINFSALAQESRLIIHTSVTIGYDVPWRQVHELLLAAARATQGVLPEPPPFVLQTSLNDFSVAYELNVYTAEPQLLLVIQSGLHQNIQDAFNEAGVEIMSPAYAAVRDGKIPYERNSV
jgi:small-conductance mechanosensitive channel